VAASEALFPERVKEVVSLAKYLNYNLSDRFEEVATTLERYPVGGLVGLQRGAVAVDDLRFDTLGQCSTPGREAGHTLAALTDLAALEVALLERAAVPAAAIEVIKHFW